MGLVSGFALRLARHVTENDMPCNAIPIHAWVRMVAFLRLALAVGVLLLAAAPAARADDDDSPSSSPSDSSSAPGQGPSGTAGEGRGAGMNLGPNPGTDPLRDLPRFVGAIGAMLRGRPPATSPPPATVGEGPVRAADELVVLGLPDAARAQAVAAGFRVLASRTPAGGATIVRLRAPSGLSPAQAVARLRALAPQAVIDRNHLYRPGAGAAPHAAALAQIAWPDRACGAVPLLGMVDTGIDPRHPALQGASIRRESTRAAELPAASRAHGTAVAVLLVGQGPAVGLLPQARLVAVDAFHRRGDGDVADAFDLAAAIQVLAAQRVAVANLSVAGPANQVIDALGRRAAASGMLLVAAAGNDGPAARPRYPAAYEWAIAVTAVDARGQVYARAVQGSHIALAAPGVGVPVVAAEGRVVRRTGTSFATPFATAALALALADRPDAGREAVLRRVAEVARDLGAPGRDPVYGWGLVQAGPLCGSESVARAR